MTSESDFWWSVGKVRPDVFVVSQKDLEQLRNLGAAIIDRGKRHSAATLWRQVLGRPRDALVDINIKRPGCVRNAVHTLLEKALRQGNRNVFFIGAELSVLAALREQAKRTQREQSVGQIGAADLTFAELRRVCALLHGEEMPGELLDCFPGASAYAEMVRELILRAAWTRVGVLLAGESGAYRAEVARHIHTLGHGTLFASLMCGAYPRDDGRHLEDELFGNLLGGDDPGDGSHGLWVLAGGGTLFIDDIDLLPPRVQARIASALRRRTRLTAGAKGTPAPRLIAGTSLGFDRFMTEGSFNLELLHQLTVVTIPLLPLRARRDDLPDIVQAMWRELTGDVDATLPDPVVDTLVAPDWPGNESELRRTLLTMLTLFGQDDLTPEHVRIALWLGNVWWV